MAIEVQYVLKNDIIEINLTYLVYQTMRMSIVNDRGMYGGGSINEQDLDEYLNIISKLTVNDLLTQLTMIIRLKHQMQKISW